MLVPSLKPFLNRHRPAIRRAIIRGRKKRRFGAYPRPAFILHEKPKSPVSEAYRMLRTNLQYYDAKKNIKSILVTSTGPGEGKTTTVLNMGYAFAQANKKTLIVDFDLRNTSFHRLLNLSNDNGLYSLLTGQKMLEDAVYKNVMIPNLDVLTSGPRVQNPAEVVGSNAVRDFIDKAKSLYDVILFDSPPTLAVTDAKLLSVHADGVIFVIRSGKVSREAAKRAKQSMKEVKANVLGVVLNDLDTTRESYYYYHKYYHAYYKDRGRGITVAPERKVEEALVPPRKAEEIRPSGDAMKARVKKSLFTHFNPAPAAKTDFEAEKISGEMSLPVDKNSSLGRKPIFFEDGKKEEPPPKAKDDGSLGRKNMFEDL